MICPHCEKYKFDSMDYGFLISPISFVLAHEVKHRQIRKGTELERVLVCLDCRGISKLHPDTPNISDYIITGIVIWFLLMVLLGNSSFDKVWIGAVTLLILVPCMAMANYPEMFFEIKLEPLDVTEEELYHQG